MDIKEKLDLLDTVVCEAFPETYLDFRLSHGGMIEGFINIGTTIHIDCNEISEPFNPGELLQLLQKKILEADYSIIEVVMKNIRTVSRTKATV